MTPLVDIVRVTFIMQPEFNAASLKSVKVYIMPDVESLVSIVKARFTRSMPIQLPLECLFGSFWAPSRTLRAG